MSYPETSAKEYEFSEKYRLVWLSAFVMINVVATFIMIYKGQLIGDASGNDIFSLNYLFLSFFLVSSSYIIILFFGFKFLCNLKFPTLNFNGNPQICSDRLGAVILLSQLSFFLFNILNGVNVAGSTQKSDSIFSLVWVFYSPDMLFFIYYGFYRDNKFFKANLAVWIISNLSRGWTGIFIVIIFMELLRYFLKNRKVNPFPIFLLISMIVVLYPFLFALKGIFRNSTEDMGATILILSFFSDFSLDKYFDIFYLGIEQIIGRLQTVSMLLETFHYSTYLNNMFYAEGFSPFWREGIPGIIYEKLFLGGRYIPIGVALTTMDTFSNSSFEVGDWNASAGFVSWFVILPIHSAFYTLYSVFLLILSIFIAKLNALDFYSKSMLWLAWLLYMMPAWFSAFIGFVLSLIIFTLMKWFLCKIPRIKLYKNVYI